MIHHSQLLVAAIIGLLGCLIPEAQGIAGGTIVRNGSWPYFISLRNANAIIGGGTIISSDTILIAAHTFSKFPIGDFVVFLGRGPVFPKPLQLSIAAYIPHPDYRHNVSRDHDIALLKLSKPINFGRQKGATDRACLAQPDDRLDRSRCITMGMGVQQTNGIGTWDLFQVELPLDDECPKWLLDKLGTALPDWICINSRLQLENKSACKGDDGGPLMCPLVDKPDKYLLLGLNHGASGCGKTSVFIKTAAYLDWIVKTAEQGN